MIATINKEKLLTKKSLEAAFKMFDIVIEYHVQYFKVSQFQDENGYITVDELRETFNPGSLKEISDNVWEELLKEVDENSDGKVIFRLYYLTISIMKQISLNEFKDMMMKFI